MDPLIKINELPHSLWFPEYESGARPNRKGIVKLPEQLRAAYHASLKKCGLLEAAAAVDDDGEDEGAIGGIEEGAAEDHFATRFSGSVARMQLYALDPLNKFVTTLDSLIATFAAGKVSVLDVPFGVGASSVSIISMLAELRKEGVLEARPVVVDVLGGELDSKAISISKGLIADLSPWWKEQNIDTRFSAQEWDVLSGDSTMDLLDKWNEEASQCDRCALVGGNFSGFLAQEPPKGTSQRRMHAASSQIRQLFARAGKMKAQVYWVEPQTKKAKNHLLPHLHKEAASATKRLSPVFSDHRLSDSLAQTCVSGKTGDFIVRASGIHLAPVVPQ